MKHLVEYIQEARESNSASKSLTFNFAGCEGLEDFLKSVTELNNENVTVEEESVKVSLTAENATDMEGVFELLQDFIQLRGKDSKRASDESYAQKLHALENKLNDWRNFVDSLEAGAAEEDDKASEKDDKKDEDKKEEE